METTVTITFPTPDLEGDMRKKIIKKLKIKTTPESCVSFLSCVCFLGRQCPARKTKGKMGLILKVLFFPTVFEQSQYLIN